MRPHNQQPPPIRTDENNAFARDTMFRRVPATIDRIIAENPDFPAEFVDALKSLQKQIKENERIDPLLPSAPDYESWKRATDARAGQRWLDTEWFFAETYFYRKVIECVRWWETGRDPFQSIKDAEYESDMHWTMLEKTLAQSAEVTFEQGLIGALWGNRIDLSFPDALAHGHHVVDDDLLVDDSEQVAEQLRNGMGAVHFIIDNAGSELTMDLVLADLLLRETVDEIYLHLKMHPTFVSDALPKDVWHFLDLLDERGEPFQAFGQSLRQAFAEERLHLLPNLYWNSSDFLWRLPEHLEWLFSGARLVIIKGDANYRRLVGDALWSPDTFFGEATGYFPAPLLALRTLKSDPIVGLPTGKAEELDEQNERWRLVGKYGVAQYKP